MNIYRVAIKKISKHPLGALYGTLLGIIVFFAAYPMFKSGMFEAALVDLIMAVVLIAIMCKRFISAPCRKSNAVEKCTACGILIAANILVFIIFNLIGKISKK